MAEYRHLGEPHPEWVDFPNRLPPGTQVDPMVRDRNPIRPQEGLDIEEIEVKVRDGHPIRLRLYRLSTLINVRLPLLVYIHGGGYVTGGLETDDLSCRAIALELPIAVASIEYRLAPEYKFPIGFEDCFDVLKWVVSEGSTRLLIDLDKGFILGGTSAGANFTAGLSHLLRDEGLTPKLTGVMFLAGSFCHPDARPAKYRERILSIDEIDNAPGLTRSSIKYFAEKYGAPPTDKRYSPLLNASHTNIAEKAYFSVCGWDPRRDESLLLDQLLQESGLKTKIDIYPGLPHGFWTTCPGLPESRKWEKDLIKGVEWLLQ